MIGKHYVPSTASPQTPLLGRWKKRRIAAKLHPADVQDIRRWAQQHPGLTVRDQATRVAQRYHVGVRAVEDILTRRAWAGVPDKPMPVPVLPAAWGLTIPARWHALLLFLLLISSSRPLPAGSSGAAGEGTPGDSRPAGPRKDEE